MQNHLWNWKHGQICPVFIAQWSKIPGFQVWWLKPNYEDSWMVRNRLFSLFFPNLLVSQTSHAHPLKLTRSLSTSRTRILAQEACLNLHNHTTSRVAKPRILFLSGQFSLNATVSHFNILARSGSVHQVFQPTQLE